jgi:hypothetical protein
MIRVMCAYMQAAPRLGAGHACQMEQPWLFDRYMIEFLKDPGLCPVLREG